LGWHFTLFDATLSSGFFAPSGPYNSGAKLNIGFGHWTGVFGAGVAGYADEAHTWSLSMFAHYLLYGSQMGRNYTLGDEVPFEWAAGKSFELKHGIFKQLSLGAVGYAQWQATNNQINSRPRQQLERPHSTSWSIPVSKCTRRGPGITLLTKYGLFSLRYYEEFHAHPTPSGGQLMLSISL
jgi:hypothetical protein